MNFDTNVFTLVVTLIGIIVSLSIHEAAHAFVGLKLGDTTAQEEGRVSLNPLKHIDPFATILLPIITIVLFNVPILAAKPVPFNPVRVKFDEFGAALIAFAGPATNFLLAFIGVIFSQILGGAWGDAFSIFAALNVGLFVFNMIPIPPLDGSRVLFALAPEWLQNFMAQIENFGIFIVFGLVLMFPGFTQLILALNNSLLRFLYGL